MVVVGDLGLLRVDGIQARRRVEEQPPQQHLRQLRVLLLPEPLVLERLQRRHHHQPSGASAVLPLVLEHSADRAVERVRQVPAGQEGDGRLLQGERGAVRVHEGKGVLLAEAGGAGARLRAACSVAACGCGCCSLVAADLLSGACDHAVEDAVADVRLLGVEVLVVHCAHDGVGVEGDGVLRQHVDDVPEVARVRLPLRRPRPVVASLARQEQHGAALRQVLLQALDLVVCEALPAAAEDDEGNAVQLLFCKRLLVYVDGPRLLHHAAEGLVALARPVHLAFARIEHDDRVTALCQAVLLCARPVFPARRAHRAAQAVHLASQSAQKAH
eukprot:Rhum_TRINITY_DN14179_c21_g1::Rhum_TRINITY_DN14179_c21_g1_i1::g.72405::m.72405